MPLPLQVLSFRKPIQYEWHWIIFGLILMLFTLKLHLLFLQNINWDEFLFLAKVHAALRGDLPSVLQTVYVHAFAWLPRVSANEVDQVIAARLVMFVLQAGTCCFIFAVGRTLFGSSASAAIGVLVYLTFSYVVDHGTSFRADPIAVFFLMAALWLLVQDRGGWRAVALAGIFTALAGMVTIKSIFYIPTLGLAVLCLRRNRSARQRVAELLAFGISALTTFLALYAAHRYSLDAAENYAAMSMVEKSADKVILLDQVFPRRTYLVKTLFRDPLAWYLLLAGFVAAAGAALRRRNPGRGIGLLGLGLPLLTLVFYRNAFPYYYVFVLAAPTILATGLVAWAESRLREENFGYLPVAFIALAVLLSASLIERYTRDHADRTITQRQIIANVHRMFPQPVPYIDRASMVASFPKAGFFMSTWGMENYRESGQPVMRDLLVTQRPVFLIENAPSLALDGPPQDSRHSLIPEDFDVLRNNFIRHWGAIWVLGKHLDLEEANTEYTFEILVPGTYTVEGGVSIVLDGIEHVPGTFVELAHGYHTALSPRASTSVKLRWGRNLYRPAEEQTYEPVFMGF